MAPTRRTVAPQGTQDPTMQPLTAEDVSNDLGEPTNEMATVQEETEESSSRTQISEPLSIEQIYLTSQQNARENHWRDNPYATGLVAPTWYDEINRGLDSEGGSDANGPNRSCCSDAAEPEMDPTCGCLYFSGHVCGALKFGRVGNMVILKESHVLVEEDVEDEEAGDGSMITRKVSKREIDLIIGPYWPMMMFVTYPLILGVSFWTAVSAVFVPEYNLILVVIWSVMTFGLCFSLFSVAFRDPGILPKYKSIPNQQNNNSSRSKSTSWRWIDSAQSFAPRGAMYDTDCAVVVEEFDHTCPWTGTAIGKKNMVAFQCFIGFLFSCLILDIILLTTKSIIL
jgi:hypothetical protein